MGLAIEVDVGAALAAVTQSLATTFEHEVTREVVEGTVAACAARWRDARVLDFVAVLTQRESMARLRILAREAAERRAPLHKDAS